MITKLAEFPWLHLQIPLVWYFLPELTEFNLMALDIVTKTFQNLWTSILIIGTLKPETLNQLLKMVFYRYKLDISPIAKAALSTESHRTSMAEHVVDTLRALLRLHIQGHNRKANATLDLLKKSLSICLNLTLCFFAFTGGPRVD